MKELAELLFAIQNGDDSAFEKLCEQYNALLLSMAKKYYEICRINGAEQDELLQEAKYALYKASCAFNLDNGNVTFGNYAKTCIRNRLVSLVRKYKSKKRSSNVVAPLHDSIGEQARSSWNELGDKLMAQADKKLSDFEKKVFSMYLAGMKGKEISRRLKKEERSVNNAIYRVKVKLKDMVR